MKLSFTSSSDYTNIRFLPPNIIIIQPIDQQVIHSFKAGTISTFQQYFCITNHSIQDVLNVPQLGGGGSKTAVLNIAAASFWGLLRFCYGCFVSSWNQTAISLGKYILILMTVLMAPSNERNWHITTYALPDDWEFCQTTQHVPPPTFSPWTEPDLTFTVCSFYNRDSRQSPETWWSCVQYTVTTDCQKWTECTHSTGTFSITVCTYKILPLSNVCFSFFPGIASL